MENPRGTNLDLPVQVRPKGNRRVENDLPVICQILEQFILMKNLMLTLCRGACRGQGGVFSVFHNFPIFLTPGGQEELAYTRFLESSVERQKAGHDR